METSTMVLRKKVRALLKRLLYARRVTAQWYIRDVNWGDALNPVLIEYLSERKARFDADPYMEKQMVVGSILELADSNTVVWGAGLIKEGLAPKDKPKAIHALRGPLTRKQLLSRGIDAPEVYGDPALLLPLFFNPDVPKKYRVGLIPHYMDKGHPWLDKHRSDPGICVIDVQGGVFSFVEAIKSCDLVVSSSLHGVICADAYGVPSIWAEFSDRVLGKGFKFFDYFASVQRETSAPVRINESTSLTQVLSHQKDYQIQLDKVRLLNACPFLSPNVKRRLEKGR